MIKRMCVSLMALSFLVSMAANSPASAKSIDGMKAQVPFDFHIGGRLVPAGAYTIKSLTDDETALRISNGRQSAGVMTSAAQKGCDAKGSPRLVFRRYGDQYFLAYVWDAYNNGRAVPESKRERSLRKELRAAGAADGTEVVILAAR